MSSPQITRLQIERWLKRNNWKRRWRGVEADPWINPDVTSDEVTVYHDFDRYKTYRLLAIADLCAAYKVHWVDVESAISRDCLVGGQQ